MLDTLWPNSPPRKFIRRLLRRDRRPRPRIHPASRINPTARIGFNTRINGPARIGSSSEYPCTIGKYCAIGNNFQVLTYNHATEYANLQVELQRRHGFAEMDARRCRDRRKQRLDR